MADDASLELGGSAFVPLAVDNAAPAREAAGATLLIVIGEAAWRTVAEQALRQAEMACVAVDSGRAALAWLEGHSARLMLVDDCLGDMACGDLLTALAMRHKFVPYVFIAAPAAEARAADMVERGARDCVVKNGALAPLLRAAVKRSLNCLDHWENFQQLEAELASTRHRLEAARAELERRVRERTMELAAANVRLRVEIDERRRAEEEVRIRQAEMAHVARLNAVGEMMAELAHELNQPLSAMANYAQASLRLLSRYSNDPPADVLTSLQQIVGQASRAAQIVHRVRTFVSKGEQARKPLPLNALIADIVQLAEVEARVARASIAFDPGDDSAIVFVDRVQIEQVLINLMRNAFEAMETGGGFPRQLTLRTAVSGSFVETVICDTGPGVPADMADRVFERFYTTKPRGIGMGLPISRSIIESHGGRLWLDTGGTAGATFRFVLPLHQNEGADERPPV